MISSVMMGYDRIRFFNDELELELEWFGFFSDPNSIVINVRIKICMRRFYTTVCG